ncbi:MAG: hypothetical protein ACRDVC_00940 [Acidimicrobiales bacterium]
MTTLRSEDWAVRPPFVENGPRSPVVLLIDDEGLTQLAGIPPVAWQTPWSEISNLELARISHQMLLFATIGGVRYTWRHRDLVDYELLRTVVVEHAGVVSQRRRRTGVFAIVAIVVLASFAGGIAAWFNRGSSAAQEFSDTSRVNLTLNDLPSGWYKTSDTILNYLVSPPSKVYTSTTTTAPPKDSSFDKVASIFQSCLGVSNAKDRVFGAAGQLPDFQVSSPIFNTTGLDGVELASTSQYYHSTRMVDDDTREMSMHDFGSCFAKSNADIVLSGFGLSIPTKNVATNWRPMTFTKGWSRGGVIALAVPNLPTKVQLVMVVITHGHYEVTLSAIVGSFTKSEGLLTTLVNTLLSRMANSSSQAT